MTVTIDKFQFSNIDDEIRVEISVSSLKDGILLENSVKLTCRVPSDLDKIHTFAKTLESEVERLCR